MCCFVRNSTHKRVAQLHFCSFCRLLSGLVHVVAPRLRIEIETLTDSNFDSLVRDGKENVWMIEFYASVFSSSECHS